MLLSLSSKQLRLDWSLIPYLIKQIVITLHNDDIVKIEFKPQFPKKQNIEKNLQMLSNAFTARHNYCTQHPNEPLTNYCSNVNCKIGLCATCICTHTQNHLKERTEPLYSNIKDLQGEVAQQLLEELEETDDILSRLKNVTEKVQNKDVGLKEVMKVVRKQAIETLSDVLDNLQQKLHNDILSDAKRHSLHNQSRIENLVEKVKKERTSLTQGIQEIKQPEFVTELKRLTDIVLEGGRQTLNKIKDQISSNENYLTDIRFDRQCLKQNMNKVIQNVVVLSFTVPESMFRRNTLTFNTTQVSNGYRNDTSRLSVDPYAQSQSRSIVSNPNAQCNIQYQQSYITMENPATRTLYYKESVQQWENQSGRPQKENNFNKSSIITNNYNMKMSNINEHTHLNNMIRPNQLSISNSTR